MARRKDGLLLYAIVGAIAYVGYKMIAKPKASGAGPATSAQGTVGGGVPGSPNQVLTPEQEIATAIAHGYTAGI